MASTFKNRIINKDMGQVNVCTNKEYAVSYWVKGEYELPPNATAVHTGGGYTRISYIIETDDPYSIKTPWNSEWVQAEQGVILPVFVGLTITEPEKPKKLKKQMRWKSGHY